MNLDIQDDNIEGSPIGPEIDFKFDDVDGLSSDSEFEHFDQAQ